MPYCPGCHSICSIVMQTLSETTPEQVSSRAYKPYSGGVREYSDYLVESTEYVTDIKTIPRCSNCFEILEFPNATTKQGLEKMEKDWFLTSKQKAISTLRSNIDAKCPDFNQNNKPPSIGLLLFTCILGGSICILIGGAIGAIVGGIIGLFSGNTGLFFGFGILGIILGLFYTIGAGFHDYNDQQQRYDENYKNNRSAEDRWRQQQEESLRRFLVLEQMEYTRENYRKFRTGIF